MIDTDRILGWHAHVYFSPDQVEAARKVCQEVADRFGIAMGQMHVAPVGPHPTGSCQLTVPADRAGDVFAWLALNRSGLRVFCHAETGDAWIDHTEHVLWLGDSLPLRLDVLARLLGIDRPNAPAVRPDRPATR